MTDGSYDGKQRGYQRPFPADGSGNLFRDAVRAVGLKELSPHGFRKAFTAEKESSKSEIAAVDG